MAGDGEAAEDAREVWHLTMRWFSPRLARVGFWRVRMEKKVCRTKSAKIRLPTIEKVQAKRWEHRRGIHRKTSPINSAFFVLVNENVKILKVLLGM